VYNDTSGYNAALVGSKPAGNGRYGQSDLAGNVWEWLVDQGSGTPGGVNVTPLPTPCVDCMSSAPGHVSHQMRGGAFSEWSYQMKSAYRWGGFSAGHDPSLGFRCARLP